MSENTNLPAIPMEKAGFARAVEAALARMDVRKEFIEKAKGKLTKGQDFGDIPGVDKPTLFKSGAEALAQSVTAEAESLFLGCGRFSKPTIEAAVEHHKSADWPLGYFFYRVSVELIGPSGKPLAHGVGSCSTQENKYARKKDGTARSGFDSANTVLKMAEKRAKVDAAISLTGASSMFTQDVEDDDTDPLEKALSFGKHAGKNPRQIVQLDRGWAEWFKTNGKKPGDRLVFEQALAEADEMAEAGREGANPVPNSPSAKAPEKPARKVKAAVPDPEAPAPAPAPVVQPDPTPAPSAPKAKGLATPEQINGLRTFLIASAESLKLQPKSAERRAYYEEATKTIDRCAGRKLVLVAGDPESPTSEDILLAVEAVKAMNKKLVVAVEPSVVSDTEAKNMEIAQHHALNRKVWPGDQPEEESKRVAGYMKLLQGAMIPPEKIIVGPRDLTLDRLVEVTRCLKKRLQNQEEGI